MRRIILLIAALALVLAGCHGSWQQTYEPWYFDSNNCGWGGAHLLLYNTDPSPSQALGTTRRFYNAGNPCNQVPKSGPAGDIRVSNSLVKSTGMCHPGPGWVNNPQNDYTAFQQWYIAAYLCGDGYYQSRSAHTMRANSWVSGATLSPVDYTCYHNPCQG